MVWSCPGFVEQKPLIQAAFIASTWFLFDKTRTRPYGVYETVFIAESSWFLFDKTRTSPYGFYDIPLIPGWFLRYFHARHPITVCNPPSIWEGGLGGGGGGGGGQTPGFLATLLRISLFTPFQRIVCIEDRGPTLQSLNINYIH